VEVDQEDGTAVVAEADIVAGLRRLGVAAGEVVLVHSSLRSFGHVRGGADAVVDALLRCVGAGGTVLVPTLSFRSYDPARPRFDARTTPSDTGRVTEVFRRRPEAVRSLHPVSSVAAIGPAAAYLTAAHLDTPCGATSPYARLAELDGACLFLGAGLASNSVFHVAEEAVGPGYLGYHALRDVRVLDQLGRPSVRTFRRYDCSDRGVRRYLGKMEPLFRREGVVRETTIGACRAMLIRARDNVRLTSDLLRATPEYILTP
jgi:aminoglycoside 3-N-acetyltransferase